MTLSCAPKGMKTNQLLRWMTKDANYHKSEKRNRSQTSIHQGTVVLRDMKH